MDKIREFINKIAPIIHEESKSRGYHICSTVIAQAIIESRYGESGLAKYHNYFGLKCGSAWTGASVNMKTKEEYQPGVLTNISANFRAYDDMASGVKGYYDFISSKRYANLKTATTYKQYAEMLKSDGYATSSTYVKTLTSTVEKYGLTEYDSGYCSNDTKYPDLYRGLMNEYVVSWQMYLKSDGIYNGKIDGIFGSQTEAAVRAYQQKHNLTVTGRIGIDDWLSVGK